MSKVEVTINPETGAAAFLRANRFILAEDGDTPNPVGSQADLAAAYALQSSRWGWPVTFPEPMERGGQELYPVLRFGTHDRDGTIIYLIERWQPAEFAELSLAAEPLEGAQAETPTMPADKEPTPEPEVISPANAKGAKAKPKA